MEALLAHLDDAFPGSGRLGVLTSDYVRKRSLFEAHFDGGKHALVYPSENMQAQCVMRAIYGERGIQSGNISGDAVDLLYAACKRLESNDAELIAIPCNTAHAYVTRIQPYLTIPIVNMLHKTVSWIVRHYGTHPRVGLLATSGMMASRVYHDAAALAGFDLMVPDQTHQQRVMEAIYGEQGVKAGHVDGVCKQHLMAALEHLVARGADIVILGCTELLLILPQDACFPVAGRTVALLDPTEILARRCVGFSESRKDEACATWTGGRSN